MKSKRSKLCIVGISYDIVVEKNENYTRWKKMYLKLGVSFSTTKRGKKGLRVFESPLLYKKYIKRTV